MLFATFGTKMFTTNMFYAHTRAHTHTHTHVYKILPAIQRFVMNNKKTIVLNYFKLFIFRSRKLILFEEYKYDS